MRAFLRRAMRCLTSATPARYRGGYETHDAIDLFLHSGAHPTVMSESAIRAYRSTDRAAVRRIAFATGFMGEPVDWLWGDAESFADVFIKYYTDAEPESLLVAEDAGVVVGYLSGCVDSGRAHGAAQREITRIIARGAFFRPSIAGFFWRALADIARDRGAPDDVLGDSHWPAHLHINLLPQGRGQGLGRQLMDAWFERLRGLASPGVHLGTFAENTTALRFFAGCGFARRGAPIPAPGFRTRTGSRMHLQWMTRAL
jgi:ribosomal protein S18 acetylase RimI-like enzyme